MTETIDKANKYICSLVKEAISDERTAPHMYANIIEHMMNDNLLSDEETEYLRSIIDDEERHERFFIGLAEAKGCVISTTESKRKLFYDLPLAERLKLAKETLSRMEEVLGK